MPNVVIPKLANNPDVAAVYRSYPAPLRKGLLKLRDLLFEAAAQTDGVGPVLETLRWGTPSYLTPETKSGTTIRLGVETKTASRFGLYVPCQTTLVADFKHLYGQTFSYNGKRGLLFNPGVELPLGELQHCIALGLTYHANKPQRAAG
jgi:hypothetical protein